MFFVIVGIAVGLAIAAGPLSGLLGPVDAAVVALVDGGGDLVAALLGLAPLEDHPKVTATVTAVCAALLPGAVAVALARATRAARKLRQAGAALLVLGAVASFFAVPFPQALALLVAALVVSAIASFATGAALVAPLTAIGTVLTVRHVALLLDRDDPQITTSAETLAAVSGVDALELWILVLSVAALLPFAWAAWAAIRD